MAACGRQANFRQKLQKNKWKKDGEPGSNLESRFISASQTPLSYWLFCFTSCLSTLLYIVLGRCATNMRDPLVGVGFICYSSSVHGVHLFYFDSL